MSKKQVNENLFGAARKLSDAFFDGLKSNMTNKALNAVKKNKKVPKQVVAKMSEIDKAAKELDDMLRELDPDYGKYGN